MQFIAILFGLVAFVSAVKQETYKLDENKIQNAVKVANTCALDNGVDPGTFARFIDGTLPTDEATNNYLYCLGVKNGFAEESGHLVVDKIASYLNHPLLEEFKEALRKCNEVTKDNPIATIVEMYRCYNGTAPVHFAL